MQTTNYSLPELLERASRKSLTIPQFQRDFTWSRGQVRLLVDSMSRSYPIGSLLLLLRNPEFEISWRSIDAVIHEQEQSQTDDGFQGTQPTEENHYVLDGQQRITSIFRVFRNADPEKLCYFNLQKVLGDHDKNNTGWVRFLDRKDGENPERKTKGRLLRADLIFDQHKTDIYVTEYIEDSGDFEEFDTKAKREAAAKVKGVFETIRNYKVPVVVLERESGVESVCRVFETINSTGTRLTTFDLAVARFYPELDLRKMWEVTLEKHPILGEFEVDGERVLQVLYLLHADERGTNYDPTRSNLFKLESNQVKRKWEISSQALAETFKWARSNGARPKSGGMKKTLPNESILVPLAAYNGLQENINTSETESVLRRWYFSKIMKGGVQASNYQISQNFLSLKQYLDGSKPLEPDDVLLDVQTVLNLKPSDVRYKSLQNVFAITMQEDFFGKALDGNVELDDHHIFPSNAQNLDGLPKNLLDSICNRVWLSRDINRSIGDQYPETYLGNLARDARNSGTLQSFKRRMAQCLIPGNPQDSSWEEGLNVSNFQDFCRKRAELILEEVKHIVGDALKIASSQDDDQDYVD